MSYNLLIMEKIKINTKKIKTRDHLMVLIINGVTKAATHTDRKKEANRRESRKKIDIREW